jgi:hypothetical protein
MGKNHVHKFFKVRSGGTHIWRCALDGCSYAVYRGQQAFIIGKYTMCWECGEDSITHIFTLTEEDLENPNITHPTCWACKTKETTRTHADRPVSIQPLPDNLVKEIQQINETMTPEQIQAEITMLTHRMKNYKDLDLATDAIEDRLKELKRISGS